MLNTTFTQTNDLGRTNSKTGVLQKPGSPELCNTPREIQIKI